MGLKFLIRAFIIASLCIVYCTENLSSQTWTQDEAIKAEENSKRGLFYVTPDIGLIFGTITQIRISPSLGYHITDRFSIAAGGSYEYYKENFSYSPDFHTHIWGLKSFARFDVIKDLGKILPLKYMGIFAHIEYEALKLEKKFFDPNYDGNYWFDSVLFGGGLIQQASPKVAFTFTALWDISNNTVSLYNHPIFRFGFQFYF